MKNIIKYGLVLVFLIVISNVNAQPPDPCEGGSCCTGGSSDGTCDILETCHNCFLDCCDMADFDDDDDVDLDDFFDFAGNFGTSSSTHNLDGESNVNLDDFFIFATAYRDYQGNPIPELERCSAIDFNEDTVVDINDFFSFSNHYGDTAGDPNWDPEYDLNGDGVVDITDFQMFNDNFGCEIVILQISRSDFNVDGTVNLDDFFKLASEVGKSPPDPYFDLDEDGVVDLNDFYIFADNFGRVITDTVSCESCDFDDTGLVDIQDLFSFANHFGAENDGQDPWWNAEYDLDNDNIDIDLDDYYLFVRNWGCSTGLAGHEDPCSEDEDCLSGLYCSNNERCCVENLEIEEGGSCTTQEIPPECGTPCQTPLTLGTLSAYLSDPDCIDYNTDIACFLQKFSRETKAYEGSVEYFP